MSFAASITVTIPKSFLASSRQDWPGALLVLYKLRKSIHHSQFPTQCLPVSPQCFVCACWLVGYGISSRQGLASICGLYGNTIPVLSMLDLENDRQWARRHDRNNEVLGEHL